MMRTSKISEEELMTFANDTKNNIIRGDCDINALLFQKKYGGDIYLGTASYRPYITEDIAREGRIATTDGHLWNMIQYEENGLLHCHIVDILNYVLNNSCIYFGHNGSKASPENIEKDIQRHERRNEKLETFKTRNNIS